MSSTSSGLDLRRVTASGIVTIAAGFTWLGYPALVPLYVIAAIVLTLAGVAMVRRRWTTPLAGLLAVTIVTVGSLVQEHTAYHLGRPGTSGFSATVLLFAGGIVAVAGAVGCLRRAARVEPRPVWPRPAWAVPTITSVGLVYTLIAVGGLVVATISSEEADPALAAAGAVVVEADEFDYHRVPSELPSGDTVFELVNTGQIEHDLVFEDADDVVVQAEAGETSRGAVDLDPGEYVVYCSIPGHRENGMEGTLTVTGGS